MDDYPGPWCKSTVSIVEYTYAWSTGTNSWFVPVVVVLSCGTL